MEVKKKMRVRRAEKGVGIITTREKIDSL